MLQIDKKILGEIFMECEKRYPEEACGLIVGSFDLEAVAEKIVPCNNIQNELHAADPDRYPRDAKTAYVIDPREIARCRGEAEEEDKVIVSIFHSHPEHDVYFSKEDKEMASPWGGPLFPNLSYLVVSVYDGNVRGASEFYWSHEKKDYLENKIIIGER